LTSGGIIASGQAVQLIFNLSGKARLHSSLATDFLAVERELVIDENFNESRLRSLCAHVLQIETREPPIKRYLDVICHNQVARSLGLNGDVYRVAWWQRMFAQWLPGDNFKPTKEGGEV
jgi:hypothetical protein